MDADYQQHLEMLLRVLVILDHLALILGLAGGGGSGGYPWNTKGTGGGGPGASHDGPGKSGFAGAGPGNPGSLGPGHLVVVDLVVEVLVDLNLRKLVLVVLVLSLLHIHT